LKVKNVKVVVENHNLLDKQRRTPNDAVVGEEVEREE